MITLANRKKGFKSPAVLLVPLLLIISFIWFNFGNQSVPAESPAQLIANQTARTGMYPESEQIPEQVGGLVKETIKPVLNPKALSTGESFLFASALEFC